MAVVPCPFCYNMINQSRLGYICLGRGVPGSTKRCVKAVDGVRERLTRIGTPSYPYFPPKSKGLFGAPRQAPCDQCGGPSGVRACPVCHTPLSATFAESRSPLIGIVGGKGAGKTVFTAVLHHELRTSVRRRFQADIRLTGDHQGGADSPGQWLERNVNQLFDNRRLFGQTASAEGGIRAPVVIEWRQPKTRMRMNTFDTTVLSFYDAAGEDQTSQDLVHTQAYLGVAGGLILLLDPWQLPAARSAIKVPKRVLKDAVPPLEVLDKITNMLRTSHQIKARHKVAVPLAVVFSKIDAFFDLLGPDHPLAVKPTQRRGYDEEAGQSAHEHVRAMLHEYGADDVDLHLEHNYARFRYFAVSALGAPPDYESDAVDEHGVQPFRVEEPLLWLLNQFGVIERSKP